MPMIVAILIVVLLLLAALAIRVPVAFALGISGTVGLIMLQGTTSAIGSMGSVPFNSTASLSLAVIPMFVMMGMLAQVAGIPEQLFRIANMRLKRLPGGLAVASVVASAGFGAVTGSSVAAAATMGRLGVTQMIQLGYRRSFAAGVVASAGTLGVLIPPSVILVLYGVVTQESIGKLLLAGLIPGLISALGFSIFIIGRAWARPASVYVDGKAGHDHTTQFSSPDRPKYHHLVWLALVFVVIIGGIYGGVFTATESGAVGVLVLTMVAAWELRKGGIRGIAKGFAQGVRDTASTSGMMLGVVIGASLFSAFLVRSGATAQLTNTLLSTALPPTLLALALILSVVVLGTILESFSLLIIIVPLIYPVITGLGYDGIWLGIVVAKAVEIGLLTPPVGMNAYVVAGSVPGLKVEETFRGIWAFLWVELGLLLLIFFVPEIVLWLPSHVN